MFQSFEVVSQKEKGPERLARLREVMAEHCVTHFLVPHADEHQNEYLPERAERLAWLTGFTGSAGFAIAGQESCIVFVDGRYTLQAREQTDETAFTPESVIDQPPSKWLEKNTTEGDTIGYDPWLTTSAQLKAYEKSCKKSGAHLKQVENLIDLVWDDQPPAPLAPVTIHPVEYAGKASGEKIMEIQKALKEKECEVCVLTDPASLAWLFNIRGSDMVHNPLPLGFAIVRFDNKPILFLADEKLDAETRDALETVAELQDPTRLLEVTAENTRDKSVLIDKDLVPVSLIETIENAGGKIVEGRDPVILPRAIKNQREIEGCRAAHIRDGVAMCRFLNWLDQQDAESVSEISAAKKLEESRAETAKDMGSELKEISFDTISGQGPNGAVVHYRVTEPTNRTFTDNSLYLCDSGGQYIDGTTDITRTIAIGSPPKTAIRDFTLVLKGHIAIAMVRFPKGTRGVDLDILARAALWSEGKDYTHGTGHGVGSYLNVHEGPQSISRRSMEPLVPGMIVSNEPGYYVEGEYGIRIENLVLVTEPEQVAGGNIETHGFETVTFCPIDLRLVDPELLTDAERNWLNDYHSEVHRKLSPHLAGQELEWLKDATRSI